MADKGKGSSKHSSKKNQGQVSRINKAEREKMKREHLNDLFVALANALEISEQTNGKACILGEATRMVKDTLKQIECLKRENEALLSEFQYVTSENNELQVENSATQDQIEKLQKVLEEKMSQINLDLNIAPPEPKEPDTMPFTAEDHFTIPTVEPTLQQPPAVTPVYVIPICPHFPVHQQPYENGQYASQPVCNVTKPHARPVVSLAYPLYASVRAIETKSPVEAQEWLTYWVLYSMITLFEITFAQLIEWIPMWSYAKVIVTCWLVIPYFSGAAYVYRRIATI